MNICEIFYSIQGEGFHTGRPAIFIRLAGCNLKCPWCDTDHKEIMKKMDEFEIARRVEEKVESFRNGYKILIVITGGEPTLYNLEPLCIVLREKTPGNVIALETNGTQDIPHAIIDWVTVSPKLMVHDYYNLMIKPFFCGEELKVVFYYDLFLIYFLL